MSPLLTLVVLATSALIGHWSFGRIFIHFRTLKESSIVLLINIAVFGAFFFLTQLEVIVLSGFVGMWITALIGWSALSIVAFNLSPRALLIRNGYWRVVWFVGAFFWPVAIFVFLFIRDNVVT